MRHSNDFKLNLCHFKPQRFFTKYMFVLNAMLLTLTLGLQDSQAQLGQGGGGQIGGQVNQGRGQTGNNQQIQQQQLQQQQAVGGGGDASGGGDDNSINDVSSEDADLLSDVDLEDVRNQGFVGATAPNIRERGFVGPPGEQTAPPLAEGRTFGGGVNGQGAGTGGAGNARGNRQNGFGGFGGVQKGFQIQRKGIRTNLATRFYSPQIDESQINQRFQNHIARQPIVNSDGSGIVVNVVNRVATVRGYAATSAEQDRMIRQLRLEPGIDRVDNQIQVLQPAMP